MTDSLITFQDVPRVRELQELQAVLREVASHHDPAPAEAVGRVQEVLRRRGHGGDAAGGEGAQASHGVLNAFVLLTWLQFEIRASKQGYRFRITNSLRVNVHEFYSLSCQMVVFNFSRHLLVSVIIIYNYQ